MECPICEKEYKTIEGLHHHLEEKHDNIIGEDKLLMEMVKNRELLTEAQNSVLADKAV